MATTPNSLTARAPVRLPPMPGEREASDRCPSIELERSTVVDGQLVFERPNGLLRALTHGFFLIRIPEGLDLAGADAFAAHFFEDPTGEEPDGGDGLDHFRGFRHLAVPGDYQGYFDREHDQWENFYIARENWPMLPPGVAAAGERLADLGITVLRSVLGSLGLPEEDWAEVTGGLTDQQGHQMLAFNHFRPEKEVRGSKFHRDSGWVTILRSVEPGLLALIDGTLSSIDPVPGYFIANFGSSIEVLTELLPTPVRANVHGVVRTQRVTGQPHRTSYVIFLDSDLDGTIYRYEDGRPRAIQSMRDFAVQEVNRTYDNENSGL
ncbi:2OG-Fe(II) oxygenase family protein [Streptomyces ossamyceticus]|uniref:2OG-Fe(II) oxygenase family protein n=1 Tax=Streptomyces ossamyceticus TaxID=249581 RepID=UPI0006E12E58|nr:2OG-Fe(II) oxygenase family protein [Streptomyces ossamyceticus]